MIKKRENIEKIQLFVQSISVNYNIDKKNIIKDFLNYIIRNHYQYLSIDFLNFVENLMHSQIQNNNVYIYYSLSKLISILST
jgi:patatin-like phospholipase/acyl hydrolase